MSCALTPACCSQLLCGPALVSSIVQAACLATLVQRTDTPWKPLATEAVFTLAFTMFVTLVADMHARRSFVTMLHVSASAGAGRGRKQGRASRPTELASVDQVQTAVAAAAAAAPAAEQ